MKKTTLFVLGLFLTGAVLVSNNLHASEDIDNFEKVNHQKTLHSLGIEVKTKELENLNTISDKSGNKWVYNDFTEREPLVGKLKEKYSEEAKTSFLEVQDKIMQQYAEVGDTVPVILLDEDLKDGSFSFSRENGEVLTFKLKYDKKNGTWSYKKEK